MTNYERRRGLLSNIRVIESFAWPRPCHLHDPADVRLSSAATTSVMTCRSSREPLMHLHPSARRAFALNLKTEEARRSAGNSPPPRWSPRPRSPPPASTWLRRAEQIIPDRRHPVGHAPRLDHDMPSHHRLRSSRVDPPPTTTASPHPQARRTPASTSACWSPRGASSPASSRPETGVGCEMEFAQSDAAAYMDWYRIETERAGLRPRTRSPATADDYERRPAGPPACGRACAIRCTRPTAMCCSWQASRPSKNSAGRRPHGSLRAQRRQVRRPATVTSNSSGSCRRSSRRRPARSGWPSPRSGSP